MTVDAPAATIAPATPALADVLADRRWVRRARPFPHVVATSVFTAPFYAAMADQFRRLGRERPELFNRGMADYDAEAADVHRLGDGPLSVFVSREWHDLVAGIAGVPGTGDVSASVHHHEPGSRRGWAHNDLAPGWFAGPRPGPDEIRNTDPAVSYHDGSRSDGVEAREGVRAVSVLFYLANGPWTPGTGGETGLFDSYDADLRRLGPAVAVPPQDNSLMLFECTPWSLHGFLGTSRPRNSVVMWLHRPKSEAVRRWGDHNVVYW